MAFKMKAKIKKLWVKALRSGEYKQATHGLTDGTGFCCLGVLCDLHRKAMKKGPSAWQGETYHGETGVPSEAVIKWAGLPEADPDVKVAGMSGDQGPGVSSLAYLNDQLGYRFPAIAELIDAHL